MHDISKSTPLIFSRKGFDSSSAFGYSPYDPETGRFIVLPIPGGDIGNSYINKILYKDIRIKPGYFEGIDAESLYDLIMDKSLCYKKKTHDLVESNYAHFDPMLKSCPWISDSKYQTGAFGQCSASQGELRNREVGRGSIFLFFGRFKPIPGRKNCMGFEIYNDGSYFIYGWMRVKKIITQFEDIDDCEVREYHPHATEEYFKRSKNNTIYIADEKLFDDLDIPGCGYFPSLNRKLLLTDVNHMDKPWFWRMPSCFGKPGYKPSHFKKDVHWYECDEEGMYIVESPANRSGQEFVSILCGESERWLRGLFLEQRESNKNR